MSTIPQPPPWVYEACPGCGTDIALQVHDLSCWQFDSRTRVALGWICDHCDHVLDTVGLFTSWPAAYYARQRELDLRSARYLADNPFIPIQPRRIVTTQSRRRGPE